MGATKRKIKRQEKGLTLKEQESLLQDLENMIGVVIAQQEYLTSIGKLEECKKFTQEFLKDCQKEVKK